MISAICADSANTVSTPPDKGVFNGVIDLFVIDTASNSSEKILSTAVPLQCLKVVEVLFWWLPEGSIDNRYLTMSPSFVMFSSIWSTLYMSHLAKSMVWHLRSNLRVIWSQGFLGQGACRLDVRQNRDLSLCVVFKRKKGSNLERTFSSGLFSITPTPISDKFQTNVS